MKITIDTGIKPKRKIKRKTKRKVSLTNQKKTPPQKQGSGKRMIALKSVTKNAAGIIRNLPNSKLADRVVALDTKIHNSIVKVKSYTKTNGTRVKSHDRGIK